MLKGIKLDLKTIAILILGGLLILSIVFRRSKSIDYHKDAIELLHEQNEILEVRNDSLKVVNNNLDKEIVKINGIMEKTQVKLNATNDKIKHLENEKSKISAHVNTLNADGISKSLTEYLNRK
jgi:chromosome segregation ATPase